MAYSKQTWATGDVITAAKLNHMEDGIGDNSFLITITQTYDEGNLVFAFDKTFNEIMTAYSAGKMIDVIIVDTDNETYSSYYKPYFIGVTVGSDINVLCTKAIIVNGSSDKVSRINCETYSVTLDSSDDIFYSYNMGIVANDDSSATWVYEVSANY